MARHKPYVIKLEPVRGCTRACPFCTISTVDWGNKFARMDLALATGLAIAIGKWHPKVRIDLDERGEPTANPEIFGIARLMREFAPKTQVSIISNGDVAIARDPAEYTRKLHDSGVNIVIYDCYDDQRFQAMCEAMPDAIRYFNETKKVTKNPWQYWGPNVRETYLIHATQANKAMTRVWRNQGGNNDVAKAEAQGYLMQYTVAEQQKKMCVRPFREMVIHHDGTVPLCCDDWRQEGVIGKFPEHSLPELWDMLDPYRRNLIAKDRSVQLPCRNCNTPTGMRYGLEMDWFKED